MKKVNGVKRLIKSTLMAAAAVLVLAGGTISAKAQKMADATVIGDNVEYAGKITKADDTLYYKYVASGSGSVSFSLRKTSLDTERREWTVSVYDKDTEKVCSDTGTSPKTQLIMVAPGSVYYVKVENYSGSWDATFSLKATFSPCPNTVTEPNDDAATAQNIAFGTSYVGVIEKSGDKDLFKITAPDSGYIDMGLFRYSNQNEKPIWKFQAFDADMNELYYGYSTSEDNTHNCENVYHVLNKNQTIYIKITNENSSAVGELYSFRVLFTKKKNVETEPNNKFEKATDIKLKKTYLGAMGEFTGDYYRFKTKGAGNYKISMKLKNKVAYGYSIKIYDSKKNLVASSKKKVYKSATVKFKAKRKKKYYIVIEHADHSFLFGGGRTIGSLYKLKVSK